MITLTIEQIINALDNIQDDAYYLEYKTKTPTKYSETGLSVFREENYFVLDGHLFSFVEQYGGEGMGDEYWIVFSVEFDGEKKFYKIPGWYQSHHGSEMDTSSTHEVHKVEKTIMVWESI
jgi:hypothetical protein